MPLFGLGCVAGAAGVARMHDHLVGHPEGLVGQAQDLLGPVGANPKGDVDRLVADQPLVADLDPQRIEEDQRIGRLQRPGLPGGDLLQVVVWDMQVLSLVVQKTQQKPR